MRWCKREGLGSGRALQRFLDSGAGRIELDGERDGGLGLRSCRRAPRKLLKRLAANDHEAFAFSALFHAVAASLLVGEVAAVIIFAWLVFGVSVSGS